MSTDPWIWIAAICTIAIFSYLWRENPLYRLFEHIFVGVSVGYSLNILWFNLLQPKLEPLVTEGRYSLLIPVFLGLLMLFRFSQKHAWISFWPLAFLIGFAGYSIPANMDTFILKQMAATVSVPMDTMPHIINGLIIFLGTLACLVYFYFSIPHKGVVGKLATTGSMLLMVSFGASFGFTVMARISLLIGRVLFLLRDWLGIVA